MKGFDIRKHFILRKSDRIALLFLLSLAALAMLVVMGIDFMGASRSMTDSDTVRVANTATGAQKAASQRAPVYYRQEEQRVERFPFDPNTADSTALLRLGLQPWQVRSIYRYRAKGGIFRKPSDFARLYGLTVKQYRELLPYIRIADDYRPAAERYGSSPAKRDTLTAAASATTVMEPRPAYRAKLQPGERVSINEADTTLLKRIPGIGSYFARRIVTYRQRLGGFYDTAQLLEIKNFPAASLSYMEVDASKITRLNVNQLTLHQLKAHPYINYLQAQAIIDYRNSKGLLRSLDDLSLHPDFPPEVRARLQPYVCF